MAKITTAAEIDVKVVGTQSVNELYNSLDKANKEAEEMAEQFGKNSKEFQEADNKVKGLSNSIDKLNAEASELSGKNIANVTRQSKEMSKGLDNVNKSTKTLSTSTGSLTDGLGGLGSGFGGAVNGAKALGQQFLKLMANPIVLLITAIVGALYGLFKAFTSTKAGGEQFDAVMKGISAVIDVVRDRVLKIGGAIVKFFKGDWKGALADAKGAVRGFGDEVAREFETARKASLKLAEVEDRMRSLRVARAKQNRDLAEAKRQATDESLSYEVRLAAMKKIEKAEKDLLALEVSAHNDRVKWTKIQNKDSDSSKEALDRLADAEERLYNAQEQSKNKLKEMQDQQRSLASQAAAQAKAAADEAKRRREEAARARDEERKEKERIAAEEAKKAAEALKIAQDIADKAARQKLERETDQFELRLLDLTEKYEKEKAILEKQNLDTLTLEANFQADKLKIESDALEEQQRIAAEAEKKKAEDKAAADAAALKAAKEIADQKAAIEQSAYNTAASFSNLIGELGNENIRVQKTQALIQIGTDTASAISSLVKMSQANPANAATGGIAGALQFATGILQITANMAKAASILGGTSPVPTATQAPQAPTPQAQTPQQGQENQVRVYVTETDIANNLSKQINLAKIGIVQ